MVRACKLFFIYKTHAVNDMEYKTDTVEVVARILATSGHKTFVDDNGKTIEYGFIMVRLGDDAVKIKPARGSMEVLEQARLLLDDEVKMKLVFTVDGKTGFVGVRVVSLSAIS